METRGSFYHVKIFQFLGCDKHSACGQGSWIAGAPGAWLVGESTVLPILTQMRGLLRGWDGPTQPCLLAGIRSPALSALGSKNAG